MLEDFGLGNPAQAQPQQSPKVRVITATRLEDLNVADELLIQYKNAVNLLEAAQHDENIPANQKAQLLNSISAIITNISKTQTDVYNAERLKTLENTLIATLKDFPEVKSTFLDAYERALNVQ